MKKSFLVRTTILAVSLVLQLSLFTLQSRGAAGDVDLSFDTGSGINGPVKIVALQPDGKMIIAGQFTLVRGLPRRGIARLNADGSGDPSFNATTDAYNLSNVRSMALQSDGKLLINHDWGFVRLNADGSLDASFGANLYYPNLCECDPVVNSIVVQPDGKVIVGGYFGTENGTNANFGLARFLTDGSLDPGFNASTSGEVTVLTLQPDGKLLANGYQLARYHTDGSQDFSFTSAPEFSWNTVFSMTVQPDAKLLVGGYFSSVLGTNRNGIARLNANGTLDSTFNANTQTNSSVRSIALQADGRIFISGYFSLGGGTNRFQVARLNANGNADGTFNNGSGADNSIERVVLQPDGKLVIAGNFTTLNGTNRNRMVRFNADGSLDGSFYPGSLEYLAYSLVVQPDGKVLLGSGIRLNADGSLDNTYSSVPHTNFNPDISVPGTDYSVGEFSLVQPDGKVLIGGYTFTYLFNGEYYDWIYSYFLYRFNADASRDTNFEPALGDPSYYSLQTIRRLTVQPDGKMLVGGDFYSLKGANRNGIARLNANGSLDASFNPGFGGSVFSLLLQPDGRVLLGTSGGLAWLNSDGSRDPCFNPNISGPYGIQVFALVVQPDGRVLIGGSFSTINGVSRNCIARLNSNGSLDTSFDPGTGANTSVRAIALQPDGNVLIGGDFLTVNGVVRPYVARLFGGTSGPRLRLFSTNNAAIVAWPSPSTGFTLQQSASLTTPNWVNVAAAPATVGLENQVTISTLAAPRFFRLFSVSTNPPSPPPQPAPAPSLTASAGDGSVSLSWTSLPGATGHHVQRATNYNGPFTTIANPTTASYTDTAVVNGTIYYYRVSITYPCGESANSAAVGVTPHVTPTVHVQSITMSFVAQGAHYYTRAVVKVVDNTGSPFYGATVTGNFTGSINNTGRTGVTSGSGDATITSSSTIKNGTVTFTVTGITTGSIGYNSGANVVTSATISR